MAEVTERDVYSSLLEYAGRSAPIAVGKTQVTVELEPQDTHVRESPDALLWVIVKIRVFEQNIRMRVPILVEAEKTGLDDALDDLRKFIERKRFPIEIPMLVVSAKGSDTARQGGEIIANFEIRQLPISRIR